MMAPAPEPVAGVIPATAALDHKYEGAGAVLLLVIIYVFDTLFAQLEVEGLVTTAVGFTVMVTFTEVPLHPFTAGVIT